MSSRALPERIMEPVRMRKRAEFGNTTFEGWVWEYYIWSICTTSRRGYFTVSWLLLKV